MIKLERGKCPKELTDEVKKELTDLYLKDNKKDVWNSPKIKESLKSALSEMSHKKCAYCECRIGIESKDVTIDHFLAKSRHQNLVVEWENLFPACLRCNRAKKDTVTTLVNPCEDNPKDFIALAKNNPFRLKGLDCAGIGKDTILEIKLNDIERVVNARMEEWEAIREKLEEIYTDLHSNGYEDKYMLRFQKLMERCTVKHSYSAVKATKLLNDDFYTKIKAILSANGVWTSKLENLETELREIALEIV